MTLESVQQIQKYPVAVSVIVPVFNGEKYLIPCLESLVRQTLNRIEIIVINDGSTDTTPQILERYAQKYPTIRMVAQENKGSARARKQGMALARGEYLGFVDADDWVEPTMFERMYESAQQHGADIVECLRVTKERPSVDSEVSVFHRDAFLERIARPLLLEGSTAALMWNRLYRNSPRLMLFEHSRFSLFEDYLFNLNYCTEVNVYVRLNEQLYHYREETLYSLSRSYQLDTFDALCMVQEARRRKFKEYAWVSKPDQLIDAHWFLQNVKNIVSSLLRAEQPLRLKIQIYRRILCDTEVIRMQEYLLQQGLSSVIDGYRHRPWRLFWYEIGVSFLKKTVRRIIAYSIIWLEKARWKK